MKLKNNSLYKLAFIIIIPVIIYYFILLILIFLKVVMASITGASMLVLVKIANWFQSLTKNK